MVIHIDLTEPYNAWFIFSKQVQGILGFNKLAYWVIVIEPHTSKLQILSTYIYLLLHMSSKHLTQQLRVAYGRFSK